VVHSHASAHYSGFANVVSFGFTEKDVLTCMLPLFHIGQHCVGTSCTESELETHCRSLLGKFEVPKVFKFVDTLPMTATGKMQKQILRKQFACLFEGS
jgi:long-subunit acyl-CoA synthetase (AMP-forming)